MPLEYLRKCCLPLRLSKTPARCLKVRNLPASFEKLREGCDVCWYGVFAWHITHYVGRKKLRAAADEFRASERVPQPICQNIAVSIDLVMRCTLRSSFDLHTFIASQMSEFVLLVQPSSPLGRLSCSKRRHSRPQYISDLKAGLS